MAETVKIYTADDLRHFRNRVNNGENKLNAILMNNINISETDEKGHLVSWVPIGVGSKISSEFYDDFLDEYNKQLYGEMRPIPYDGVFDGNGHTISGLFIDSGGRKDKDAVVNPWKVAGLFGYNIGTIKNLTVSGFIKNTTNSTAGIAAENGNAGIIDNCANRCSVAGESNVGGIVGRNIGNGIVNRCINSGIIMGSGDSTSGIAGLYYIPDEYISAKFRISNRITNCVNKGDLLISYSIQFFQCLRLNNFRFNQIYSDFGDYRNGNNNNKQEGKVFFPFQNTLTGMYFYSCGADHTTNITEPFTFIDFIKELLIHDLNHEYVNNIDQTYLHLACLGLAERRMWYEAYGVNVWKQYLTVATEIITLLATETDIDFEAKDLDGKTAADYIDYPEIKDLIKLIAREKAGSKQDDDTFSAIGF